MRALRYCDYNAGAPLRPEARAAVLEALEVFGNASSIHGAGRRVRAAIEGARERIAAAVSADPANLIFTSGATEALHLAMAGARAAGVKGLLLSAIEHDALAEEARKNWPEARIVSVSADGVLDLEAFASALSSVEQPALAAIMLVNNETGVIQPVAAAARLAREVGALLLVDAAQALGRMNVDLQALDAAYLVGSSHKLGGPLGAGFLALAPGAPFASPRSGGGQERGRRPGTENMPAIVGFAAALDAACAARAAEIERVRTIRDAYERDVLNGAPDAVVYGQAAPRAPHVSLLALPGLAAETAIIGLDLEGFAVSSGAACSSGKVRTSRVLTAMGAHPQLTTGALRASFGWASADEDGPALATALIEVRRRAALAMKGAA